MSFKNWLVRIRLPGKKSKTDNPYDVWIRKYDTITNVDRAEIKEHIERLKYQPKISLIMPTYNTLEITLRQAIESVQAQLYDNWELCIADDCSSVEHVCAVINELAIHDSRIRWVRRRENGHISAASNTALSLATGEFVALMDHDDLLAETALYEVLAELNLYPNADLLYSDEDRIDEEGRRHSPYFKTDWNPELFLGQNYISHLGVYRRAIVESMGGFRQGFEGSQDYDLALRMARLTVKERIRHIPSILYHWRAGRENISFSQQQIDRCVAAARLAKSEYLDFCGENAVVKESALVPTWDRISRNLSNPKPLVSIIVCTRDRHDLLAPCIDGILYRTDYKPIELIVVDHQSTQRKTQKLLRELKETGRARIIQYIGEFNFSKMNNIAVDAASGSIIALVNNDINVIEREWLSEMVAIAEMEQNGAVGAKLLYLNGRVQHGGVRLGVGGVAAHIGVGSEARDPGYFGRLALTSNVSAVTAACLVVRKAVFLEVGGLDEINLPVSFNDVDFCLKLRSRGYLNVWTPNALLYHHESPSRGKDTKRRNIERAQREVDYFVKKWARQLKEDPYYNPNLSLKKDGDFAFPPRRAKPWNNNPR